MLVNARVFGSPEDDMVVKRLHITGPQNEAAEIVLGTGGESYR